MISKHKNKLDIKKNLIYVNIREKNTIFLKKLMLIYVNITDRLTDKHINSSEPQLNLLVFYKIILKNYKYLFILKNIRFFVKLVQNSFFL